VSSAATRIRLLVNPEAGGGRAGRRVRTVAAALERDGLTVNLAIAEDRDQAGELAASAARDGETVVTLGGDGIAGAAANGLREVPGAVLGIVPAGRGNDLARVLRIPSDPVAACAVVARGVVRPMDLGEVDGRAFVGIASTGFDSEANRIANMAPSWLGSGVYAYGALRALLRWKPATFRVEVVTSATEPDPPVTASGPVADVEFAGFSVAFANSRCFGGGMRLAPDACLDDALLEMVAIAKMPRVRYAWNLRKVFKGGHLQLSTVQIDRIAEAVVSADRPFTMYADGDPIGELPVRVRVLPAAIGVLTPRACPEAFGEWLAEHTAAGAPVAADGRLAEDHPERAAGPHTLA
jgi:YegS/Rv2252/BmrU family lipid kinase